MSHDVSDVTAFSCRTHRTRFDIGASQADFQGTWFVVVANTNYQVVVTDQIFVFLNRDHAGTVLRQRSETLVHQKAAWEGFKLATGHCRRLISHSTRGHAVTHVEW